MSLSTPLVSVIIPCFNSARWIGETLRCAACQTYEWLEVIVVDDGSTDSTIDLASEIVDSRIRIYPIKRSSVDGPAAARNYGLEHATGEFVAFLDHDDCWKPQKIERQLRAIQEDPECGWAYSWVDIIDESSVVVASTPREEASGRVLYPLLFGSFLWTGSNPLIRRTLLERLGGFSTHVGPADDWDLWLRLAEHADAVCVPHADVLWRRTQTSTSRNHKRMIVSGRRVLEGAFQRNPLLPEQLRSQAISKLYLDAVGLANLRADSRQDAVAALGYLAQAVRARPQMILRAWEYRWLARGLVKIGIFLCLPRRLARRL